MHYVARLARLVMLYLLIVGVVKKPEHFRWVVLLLVLGSLTWGIDAFIDPDRRGGRLRRVGGTDSLNDNSAAAQLLIVLPFIALYFLRGRLWEKGVALVTAPFVMNTIILCNSRGATLAAGVAAATALTLVKGKLRLQILGAVIAAAVMAYALVDPQFVQRQMTLTHEEDQRDTSSQDRLTSWKAALHLIQDHPFGAGGGGFELLSPEYIPDIVARHGGELRSVHNTYLAIATDWGLPGFACFAMFLYTTFRALRDLRRRTRDPRIYLESAALQLSLTAFLAAAMFLNRQYAEALYWMAALSTALVNIQRSVEEAPAKARAPAAAEEAGAERAEPVDAR